MPWFLGVLAGLGLCACGRTALDRPEPHDAGRSRPDVTLPDGAVPSYDCVLDPPTRTGTPCSRLSLRHATEATCSITLVSCGVGLDGEAFQPAPCHEELCGGSLEAPITVRHRVLAMNRCGRGHIVGWADGTTVASLYSELHLGRYLGRASRPRVARVGGGYGCEGGPEIPGTTFLGQDMPAEYLGAPEALARDWDVIVLCHEGWRAIEPALMPTLSRFVMELGRGVLVVEDIYASFDGHPSVNELTAPCGFSFERGMLPWATATASITCVPDF